MPHSQPNGFYSWTHTPANSMQVSIMQSDDPKMLFPVKDPIYAISKTCNSVKSGS